LIDEMELEMTSGSEARFAAYVEDLSTALGHADRTGPLRDYCPGLLMPVERKSVGPMAAVTAPARVAAQHQSLLHCVGQGGWSDDRVLAKVRDLVLPAMERNGAIEAWIIDDTGFPKKGKHSVGVARQYCGQLGKQDNCQVAVSLSIANHAASLPIAYKLYMPEDWSADPIRRSKAGIPDDLVFRTKPEIALDQIRAAFEAGIPRGVVLMDAGYGADTRLRTDITALGPTYVAGIQPHTTVKYWLSTLPETITFVDLVDTAKLRWRIERDYQELKQEVDLGHYEGRGWRGFHHHATLCIAAYAFLISEREAFSPSGSRTALHGAETAVPRRGRPDRAAHPTRATRTQLHRHHAPQADRCSRQEPRSMSLLPSATTRDQLIPTFVTQ